MQKPIQNSSDYALKLTKGALGAIPFAGSFIGELMEIIIVPQYQKRLEEWFDYIDQTLKTLIENGERTKSDFFDDEEFQSIFQKSSRAYINNIEKEKIPLLKSYFKSAVSKTTELNKKLIFLEMIENLTVKHLMILRDVNENENSDNYKYQDELTENLAKTYTDGDKSYYKLLENGLQNYHLLGYWSANVVENNKNQWNLRTSKIGKELIKFITE
ncbi:hypothetical protein [Flavobacterium sp.]|uniref:hypothetical protein n=1 Tax=Flavobacterium sp. TaxID=239 RepID=UPI002CCD94D7|nr:hypothetical protein [Flavobacterium sp.]HSD06363.1 hypothetical protein [Flavobacterium sp.]